MNRVAEWLPDNTAALVYATVNRKYLTGFDSSLGFLVISKNAWILYLTCGTQMRHN